MMAFVKIYEHIYTKRYICSLGDRKLKALILSDIPSLSPLLHHHHLWIFAMYTKIMCKLYLYILVYIFSLTMFYTWISQCKYLFSSVDWYIYIYIYIYVCTYTYIYIYIYIYIFEKKVTKVQILLQNQGMAIIWKDGLNIIYIYIYILCLKSLSKPHKLQ